MSWFGCWWFCLSLCVVLLNWLCNGCRFWSVFWVRFLLSLRLRCGLSWVSCC